MLVGIAFLAGCASKDEPFALEFAATAEGAKVACTDAIGGLGPDGSLSVRPSDLRFYVSQLTFWDEDGQALEPALDENDFQYQGRTGQVSLIDLTDDSCAAISGGEGTARTNATVTGTVAVDRVASVSFDVGVSQALMREVIGATTAEAAPSPLNELHWSWAGGYRHLVFNFAVHDGADGGEGYVHVGSTDCAGKGELALQERDVCGFLNTPQVRIDDFDPGADTVAVDIPGLLASLDFLSPIYDPETFEVIGEAPGVECHSSPVQPDCAAVFANVGIDIATGDASAADNRAFGTL
jgi:uncharacterized repeat protein (TIGR04052 family)